MLKVEFKKNIKSTSGGNFIDISTSFNLNEITGIYGNSGEGKTTIFNIISGLVHPENGKISYDDTIWFDSEKKINVHAQHRNIGYLFQEDSLFPHFTVKENILYAIGDEQKKNFDLKEVLAQVEMSGFEDVFPKDLSGGQKQRVAIARALAQKTKLLLLDEPFSALDLEIKQKLYKLILTVKKEFNLTILLVAHDINDIYALCDNVLWLKKHQASKLHTISNFKSDINKVLRN